MSHNLACHSARSIGFIFAIATLGLPGCGDIAGPADDDRTYNLTHVNGIEVPAIAVEGTCSFIWTYPDSIWVDGGRLVLGHEGNYELYYTWRGQTDACTVFGVHWHRISAGRYEFVGDRLDFEPEVDPAHRPTGYRGSSPGRPSGRRDGDRILVNWGGLHLRFAPKGTAH